MIEICESSQVLVQAQREGLTMYAPVAANDRIDLAARYWANEPRSKDHIRIGDLFTFLYEAYPEGPWVLTYGVPSGEFTK